MDLRFFLTSGKSVPPSWMMAEQLTVRVIAGVNCTTFLGWTDFFPMDICSFFPTGLSGLSISLYLGIKVCMFAEPIVLPATKLTSGEAAINLHLLIILSLPTEKTGDLFLHI